MLCRRLAVQSGMRWQDATHADIYPLLHDLSAGTSPERDMETARKMAASGLLKMVE